MYIFRICLMLYFPIITIISPLIAHTFIVIIAVIIVYQFLEIILVFIIFFRDYNFLQLFWWLKPYFFFIKKADLWLYSMLRYKFKYI